MNDNPVLGLRISCQVPTIAVGAAIYLAAVSGHLGFSFLRFTELILSAWFRTVCGLTGQAAAIIALRYIRFDLLHTFAGLGMGGFWGDWHWSLASMTN
jgi:hypothetical protein